jgi:hypothetical protein
MHTSKPDVLGSPCVWDSNTMVASYGDNLQDGNPCFHEGVPCLAAFSASQEWHSSLTKASSLPGQRHIQRKEACVMTGMPVIDEFWSFWWSSWVSSNNGGNSTIYANFSLHHWQIKLHWDIEFSELLECLFKAYNHLINEETFTNYIAKTCVLHLILFVSYLLHNNHWCRMVCCCMGGGEWRHWCLYHGWGIEQNRYVIKHLYFLAPRGG